LRKLICILTLTAGGLSAQPNAPLPSLAQAAGKASADWEGLAKGLEAKIARMLPCDPRVRAAIDEVKSASDARLTALNRYLQAASAEARRDADRARAAAAAAKTAARDLDTDRAEAEQERIAVEGELADLAESVKKRPSLAEAQKKLEAVADIIRRRSAELQQQANTQTALAASLGDIAALCQARQRTLDARVTELALETLRWSEYYSARVARAQTECSILNPGLNQGAPAPRKKPQ